MNDLTTRRKRRRRPTLTPRFGSNTVALEIGILRVLIEQQKEFDILKKDDKDKK